MTKGIFNPFGTNKPDEEKKKVSKSVFDADNPLDTEKPRRPVPFIALESSRCILRFEYVGDMADVQKVLLDAVYAIQVHSPQLIASCKIMIKSPREEIVQTTLHEYRGVSSLTRSFGIPATTDEEFVSRLGELFTRVRDKSILAERNITVSLKG